MWSIDAHHDTLTAYAKGDRVMWLFARRTACGLALIMVGALTITGCTSQTEGTGTPTAARSSTIAPAGTLPTTRSPFAIPPDWAAPPTAPSGPVPTVAHPLDASKFVAAPCSSLTTADVTGLGIADPTVQPYMEPTQTFCTWSTLPAT
jgi:hypothetical protein